MTSAGEIPGIPGGNSSPDYTLEAQQSLACHIWSQRSTPATLSCVRDASAGYVSIVVYCSLYSHRLVAVNSCLIWLRYTVAAQIALCRNNALCTATVPAIIQYRRTTDRHTERTLQSKSRVRTIGLRKKVKVGFLYSAAYAMTGPACFIISEVAVDWQEPMVLQRKLRPSNCTR